MFCPLNFFLKRRTERYQFKDQVLIFQVYDSWKKTIEEFYEKNEISKKGNTYACRPLEFKNRKLVIQTKNSSFSQELQLNKKSLIEALNKELKKKLVEDLIFKS